jgi:alkylation response protein AidB-like acyl-CoA dehydrogenase
MFREGAGRFLQESYTFERRRGTLRSPARCDEDLWRSFADLGWLALTVPEDAGGLAAGMVEAALLAEELGRRMVVEPFATTAILCARIIDRSGSAGHRAALLGAIADGSLRVALACLEPGRRYELAETASSVRRSADGFVLSGSKVLSLDAPTAHQLIVPAAMPGNESFGLFVVAAESKGVTQRAYPLIDGRRASDVDFDDVVLPATALLCDGPKARGVLDEALDRLAVFEVADALGAMEAVLELTAEHLRNRRQFGQPLAAFQALQHRMAEMFVEVQETRSALYHALAHIEAEPTCRNAAVSSAKVVASEAGRIVGGQGIQLHGGVGMTDEYQVGHYFKRLLVLEKSWGDGDYHLDRIARTYR